nr:retrovirus-related Pol polyprotein from transposon TNT 1-94 [Tanacetum cinerariifolium]
MKSLVFEGSELGSELTSLAGSELGLANYREWGYILKSIDEGPFQRGTVRETLAKGTEGVPHLGPERPRVYSDLTPEEKERPPSMELHSKQPQNSEYFKDKMLLMQAKENEVALDEEQLLFIAGGQDNVVDEDVDEQPFQDLALNVDNVFQADDYDAFDSDVDEAPTVQTMIMVNLSSVDPVYDEADPSYDSNILFEIHDHDHDWETVFKHHELHEMHDDAQPEYVVESYDDYTSDSNMILYDQYVKDNAVPIVQSNVSSVPNDAYMMILNDMHEQPAQHVSVTT